MGFRSKHTLKRDFLISTATDLFCGGITADHFCESIIVKSDIFLLSCVIFVMFVPHWRFYLPICYSQYGHLLRCCQRSEVADCSCQSTIVQPQPIAKGGRHGDTRFITVTECDHGILGRGIQQHQECGCG